MVSLVGLVLITKKLRARVVGFLLNKNARLSSIVTLTFWLPPYRFVLSSKDLEANCAVSDGARGTPFTFTCAVKVLRELWGELVKITNVKIEKVCASLAA